MTFKSWITRALAITLVVPTLACQVDEGDLDAAEDATDADDEDDDEDDDDDEFRLFCPVFPGSAPTPDVNGSLAGAPQSVTHEGAGTGNACDRFTLGVASPSGHRAHEVTFGGAYLANSVDAVVGVWARSCTSGGMPLCTTWASIPVEPGQDQAEIVDCDGELLPGVPICVIAGVATLPANNTYAEVRAGIRVETGGGTSQPAMITISE
jgi:hypothetical protein